MVYGFSYMGALFVLFIMAPAFLFANLPRYPAFHSRKKWVFAALDRLGLTASIIVALIYRNSGFHGVSWDLILLVLAWATLIGYELHWVYCLRHQRDPLVFQKIPLMLLPALALLLLALYGRHIYLGLSAIVYGIGHGFGLGKQPDIPCDCPCCRGQED